MVKKLQINLPVMLHFEKEIKAFNEAGDRLRSIGEKYGVQVNMGAFLPFMPKSSRTPENLTKQIENQKKYHLPVKIAETGVYHQNSLSNVSGDPTYDSK